MNYSIQSILRLIDRSPDTWLLLDYDGTLAEFEPTPGIIRPDSTLQRILANLVGCTGLHIAVISGRRLKDLRKLLPVSGLWLAGTYGMEWFTPQGEQIIRGDFSALRTLIEKIKQEWQDILNHQEGFYLEDKGTALAIHAKYASSDTADSVLDKARKLFEQMIGNNSGLRIILGDKFLEIVPLQADKGNAVTWLLDQNTARKMLLVYVGDDDRDEVAFKKIHEYGGIAIKVGNQLRPTAADTRLDNPSQVRKWIDQITQLKQEGSLQH